MIRLDSPARRSGTISGGRHAGRVFLGGILAHGERSLAHGPARGGWASRTGHAVRVYSATYGRLPGEPDRPEVHRSPSRALFLCPRSNGHSRAARRSVRTSPVSVPTSRTSLLNFPSASPGFAPPAGSECRSSHPATPITRAMPHGTGCAGRSRPDGATSAGSTDTPFGCSARRRPIRLTSACGVFAIPPSGAAAWMPNAFIRAIARTRGAGASAWDRTISWSPMSDASLRKRASTYCWTHGAASGTSTIAPAWYSSAAA